MVKWTRALLWSLCLLSSCWRSGAAAFFPHGPPHPFFDVPSGPLSSASSLDRPYLTSHHFHPRDASFSTSSRSPEAASSRHVHLLNEVLIIDDWAVVACRRHCLSGQNDSIHSTVNDSVEDTSAPQQFQHKIESQFHRHSLPRRFLLPHTDAISDDGDNVPHCVEELVAESWNVHRMKRSDSTSPGLNLFLPRVETLLSLTQHQSAIADFKSQPLIQTHWSLQNSNEIPNTIRILSSSAFTDFNFSLHTLRQWIVHIKFPVSASMMEQFDRLLYPFKLGRYLPHSTFELLAPEYAAAHLRLHADVLFVAALPSKFKYRNSLRQEVLQRARSLHLMFGSQPVIQVRASLVQSSSLSISSPHPSWRDSSWLSRAWEKVWTDAVLEDFHHATNTTCGDDRAQWQKPVLAFVPLDSDHVTLTMDQGLATLEVAKMTARQRSRVELTVNMTSTTWMSHFFLLDVMLTWMSEWDVVSSLDVVHTFSTNNKHARLVTQTNAITAQHHYSLPAQEMQLNGSGVLVALGDTGVDFDSCFFHDPLHAVPVNAVNYEHRKIITYITVVDPKSPVKARAAPGDHLGHGTHTAGSVAGHVIDPQMTSSPTRPTATEELSQYNGIATAARLIIHDFSIEGDNNLYVPESVYDEYLTVIVKLGAHISSNSWGDDSGVYDEYSSDVDRFLRDHPHHLMIMAAGNEGSRGLSTIGTPACSKNVLTVGASLNHPDSFSELGFNTGLFIETPERLRGAYMVKPADFGVHWFEQQLQVNISVVLAHPFDACTPLQFVNAHLKVVVAKRGNCKYYLKAKHIEESGGVAMILISDEDGAAVQMSTDENAPNLSIPSVMIDKAHGAMLSDPNVLLEVRLSYPLRFDGNDFNENQLSSWSSRGPTRDGRIKPDIVTPGEFIQSAASTFELNDHQCWSPLLKEFNRKRTIREMEGTSMATPIAAGLAALLRQFFVDGFYRSPRGDSHNIYADSRAGSINPTSSLLKAMMSHGTQPLTGTVHEKSDATKHLRTVVLPPPSVYQGHGRVQLDQVINFPQLNMESGQMEVPFQLFVDDASSLFSLQSRRYCFRILPASSSQSITPFKATLAWIDPPGSTRASFILVNQFDLLVQRVNDGHVWIGNDRSHEDHIPMQWDANNNLEKVIIATTFANELYMVVVRATHIPSEFAANYSLVVTGEYKVDSCPLDVMCPNGCSGHGRCVTTSCHTSSDVDELSNTKRQDVHGRLQSALIDNGQCACDPFWAGADCSAAVISLVPEPSIATEHKMAVNQWMYFGYRAPTNIVSLTWIITRIGNVGDPDFYITSPSRPGIPTLDYWAFKDTELDDKMPQQPARHELTISGRYALPGLYILGVWAPCCVVPTISVMFHVSFNNSLPSENVPLVFPSAISCDSQENTVLYLNNTLYDWSGDRLAYDESPNEHKAALTLLAFLARAEDWSLKDAISANEMKNIIAHIWSSAYHSNSSSLTSSLPSVNVTVTTVVTVQTQGISARSHVGHMDDSFLDSTSSLPHDVSHPTDMAPSKTILPTSTTLFVQLLVRSKQMWDNSVMKQESTRQKNLLFQLAQLSASTNLSSSSNYVGLLSYSTLLPPLELLMICEASQNSAVEPICEEPDEQEQMKSILSRFDASKDYHLSPVDVGSHNHLSVFTDDITAFGASVLIGTIALVIFCLFQLYRQNLIHDIDSIIEDRNENSADEDFALTMVMDSFTPNAESIAQANDGIMDGLQEEAYFMQSHEWLSTDEASSTEKAIEYDAHALEQQLVMTPVADTSASDDTDAHDGRQLTQTSSKVTSSTTFAGKDVGITEHEHKSQHSVTNFILSHFTGPSARHRNDGFSIVSQQDDVS